MKGQKPRFRRRWKILLAVPLILAAGWSLLWVLVAHQMEQQFIAWQDAARGAGWEVRTTARDSSGWPFALRLGLGTTTLAGPAEAASQNRLSWTAPRAELQLSLFNPSLLLLELNGPQRLRLGANEMVLEAASMRADIPLGIGASGAPPGRIPLQAKAISLVAQGEPAPMATADTASLVVEFPSPPGAWVRIALSAAQLTLPGVTARGLALDAATLDVTLRPPVPAEPTPRQSLAAWRMRGGQIDIGRADLRAGTAALTLTGRIELDAALQPAGEAQARVQDFPAILDRLATAGALPARTALAAKAVLSLMAPQRPAGAASASEADIPLTLKDRTLSLSRIPLMRFAPIDWP